MGKNAQATVEAEQQAEIDEINAQLTGFPQAVASNDGRTVDVRPITDREIDLHVPTHVAENYEALVASRHGGDWSALADTIDREGDAEREAGRTQNVRPHRVMAAWARKRADEGKPAGAPPVDPPATDPLATPPKGRTAPAKSTT